MVVRLEVFFFGCYVMVWGSLYLYVPCGCFRDFDSTYRARPRHPDTRGNPGSGRGTTLLCFPPPKCSSTLQFRPRQHPSIHSAKTVSIRPRRYPIPAACCQAADTAGHRVRCSYPHSPLLLEPLATRGAPFFVGFQCALPTECERHARQ